VSSVVDTPAPLMNCLILIVAGISPPAASNKMVTDYTVIAKLFLSVI